MMQATQEQKDLYLEVEKLYDFSNCIFDAIELDGVADKNLKLELFEPIARKLIESADRLSEVYLDYIEFGRAASKQEIMNTEKIVRMVYTDVKQLIKKIDNLS